MHIIFNNCMVHILTIVFTESNFQIFQNHVDVVLVHNVFNSSAEFPLANLTQVDLMC